MPAILLLGQRPTPVAVRGDARDDEGTGGLTCHEPDKLQPPDAPLIARLSRREPAALEELIALHQPRVLRLASRLMNWNAVDAQDVAQDVFLAAWRHAGRFRGDASLSTWLLRITVNACRSRRRRAVLGLRWLRSPKHQEESRIAEPAADVAAISDDTADLVRRAVDRLQRGEREVVVMYYLEQLPSRQIAEALSISIAAVDVRLHRARAKLREMLAPHVQDLMP
jgi:RNA polymerase sigma-70 factor (ECF subfamily)